MPTKTWKDELAGLAPEAWEGEIDVYETQLLLKKRGKLDDKLFAETRLRRGAYGQRYDNGHRHDGVQAQTLDYPAGDLLKGPETLWDAPGMQRIKVPFGRVSIKQLEVMAECAEEYSDAILHVTTRQDIQLHHLEMEETVELQRALVRAGVTTVGACADTVRNVTASHLAGVVDEEVFDVTPYAHALTEHFLFHAHNRRLPRKFKIGLSGSARDHAQILSCQDVRQTAQECAHACAFFDTPAKQRRANFAESFFNRICADFREIQRRKAFLDHARRCSRFGKELPVDQLADDVANQDMRFLNACGCRRRRNAQQMIYHSAQLAALSAGKTDCDDAQSPTNLDRAQHVLGVTAG